MVSKKTVQAVKVAHMYSNYNQALSQVQGTKNLLGFVILLQFLVVDCVLLYVFDVFGIRSHFDGTADESSVKEDGGGGGGKNVKKIRDKFQATPYFGYISLGIVSVVGVYILYMWINKIRWTRNDILHVGYAICMALGLLGIGLLVDDEVFAGAGVLGVTAVVFLIFIFIGYVLQEYEENFLDFANYIKDVTPMYQQYFTDLQADFKLMGIKVFQGPLANRIAPSFEQWKKDQKNLEEMNEAFPADLLDDLDDDGGKNNRWWKFWKR